ncbi:hypothetical protein GCM10025859_20480 [Alicyclobacillus fastidiosus]|nr:hypothetical protein GCM10025859_20480 [Alicyclobacillus fastidiosus]
MAFQESEYSNAKAKERYKIEAKNSELKHRHGYDVASSSGLVGMELRRHGNIHRQFKANIETDQVRNHSYLAT